MKTLRLNLIIQFYIAEHFVNGKSVLHKKCAKSENVCKKTKQHRKGSLYYTALTRIKTNEAFLQSTKHHTLREYAEDELALL